MFTYFIRNVYLNLLLFTINNIFGVLSIEVVTALPPKVENVLKNANGTDIKNILSKTNGSRRILSGTEAAVDRPYMVYLKLPMNNAKFKDYGRWLCGGVIVHEEYILTSAACIEDVKHFYIVSGTYKHSENFDRYNNMCIKNGAKKAVWKCIPRNYIFDGHENDNIRWMNNDIAVVKVDEEFDFTRRIRGCDYIPRPICYNNESTRFEQPGTEGSIAGWGSVDRYEDWVNSRKSEHTQNLLETSVILISKNQCKKRWGRRYHNIIENYMICTMDIAAEPSEICNQKYVDCTEIDQSAEYGDGSRRRVLNPEKLSLHSAYHNESGRKQMNTGGFCENDHGGPLIYGSGGGATVVGIISACLVKERTNECYGPFLYTSVYKNRILINCAIFKEATQCSKMFRNQEDHIETEMSWVDHPDGPAKSEQWDLRRKNMALKNITKQTPKPVKLKYTISNKIKTLRNVIKQTPKPANPKYTTSNQIKALRNVTKQTIKPAKAKNTKNNIKSTKGIRKSQTKSNQFIQKIFRVPDYPLQHMILRKFNVQNFSLEVKREAKNVVPQTNMTMQTNNTKTSDIPLQHTGLVLRTSDDKKLAVQVRQEVNNVIMQINNKTETNITNNNTFDTPLQHRGLILRTFDGQKFTEVKHESENVTTQIYNRTQTNKVTVDTAMQHTGLIFRTSDDRNISTAIKNDTMPKKYTEVSDIPLQHDGLVLRTSYDQKNIPEKKRVLSIEVGTTVPPVVKDALKQINGTEIRNLIKQLNGTRRILEGSEATNTRPYMVYLKLPINSAKFKDYRRWLCGGVIVHEEYILTSAACIEDVKHFYVVAGTYKHSEQFDRYNNMCIKNGAKKAVWKCIPKNYVFDGHENDNIRWMNNDIAVVKVDEEFDFTRRVRGCDYTPRPACYNNQSTKFEEPGTVASVAGWGSTHKYNDWVNSRRNDMEQDLLESGVVLIPKNQCKKRWGRRYHNIIENYMVCTMDKASDPSEICNEKYVDCTDIAYSDEENEGRRRVLNPESLMLHSAYHNETGRRQSTKPNQGGFCENDHGGPLVHGTGVDSMVIGIISACLVKEKSNECYGPFLYTSVYKNRILINCAIYKEGTDCSKLFRSSETYTEVEMSWVDHPDGPAKSEIKMRRNQEKLGLGNVTSSSAPMSSTMKPKTTQDPKGDILIGTNGIRLRAHSHANSNHSVRHNMSRVPDVPMQHIGLILRTSNVQKLSPEMKHEAKNVTTSTNTPTQSNSTAN